MLTTSIAAGPGRPRKVEYVRPEENKSVCLLNMTITNAIKFHINTITNTITKLKLVLIL